MTPQELSVTTTVTDALGYHYQTRSLVADEATAQRDAEDLLSRIRQNHPTARVDWTIRACPVCAGRGYDPTSISHTCQYQS